MTTMQATGSRNATLTRLPVGRFLLGRRSRAVVLTLAGVVLLASALVHLQVILTTTGARWDMRSYLIQSDAVLHHQNVYEVTRRYPYPPVWIWIVGLLRWLSITMGVRFDALIKIPATIGDFGIAVVLLLYSYRRFGWSLFTLIPMTLYALNPLALIIGAGHGQFDSLVIFFLLLAVYLRGPGQNQRIVWSALALGMAIALKGYPALALPYFIACSPRGSRLMTLIGALAPLAVSDAVYSAIFGVSTKMVTNVLGYRSTIDFGWSALELASRFAPLFNALEPALTTVLLGCTILFVATCPALLFRGRPVAAMTMLFAGFYALTPTMSVQYLVWILPFLCLAFPGWALVFTIAGLFGIAQFYLGNYLTAIPSAGPWRDLLAPFVISHSHAVMVVIGVSACLALYTLATASSWSARIQARLPLAITRRLDALRPLRIDSATTTNIPFPP